MLCCCCDRCCDRCCGGGCYKCWCALGVFVLCVVVVAVFAVYVFVGCVLLSPSSSPFVSLWLLLLLLRCVFEIVVLFGI